MRSTVLSLASIFTVEARDYQNIRFDAAAAATTSWVILGIGIGIILLSLYAFYQRRVVGGILRLLIREGALSPEAAKTAAELGLAEKPFLLFVLRHDATLKKMVKTATDEKEMRLYLPEEQKYRAEVRFEPKGGVVSLIVTALLTLGACILVIRLLPPVLGLFDKFIGK